MNFPETFRRAIDFVFLSEGGTNHDPVDRGGETKFGISKKQYPHLEIWMITKEQAESIYFHDYWMKYGCNQLPSPIAIALFDSCVNCGPVAVKWLQRSINGDNNFVVVDGLIGPKTILAVQAMLPYRLSGRLVGYRIQHYADLIKKYPAQVRFIRGWNKRAGYLLQYI